MFHGARTDVVLSQHWQWPYILGSFLVAWLGSLTALHIMKQRTSDKGVANLVYLLAGSTAFGAVGVWSMHFVGMQALSLIDPSTGEAVEVRYDPLLTAFSLVVVVVIVMVGFYVAGDPLNQQWWRYVFGGVAGAGGVLTMHFLGMLAMTTQAVIEFDWRWVLGSVLIGVAVVSVGLLVFFRFRQLWQHNQLVLLACSLVLGVAVMGVHYSGLQSATYYKTVDSPDFSDYSPVARLLAVNIALASATCAVALLYLAIKYARMLQHERRKMRCLVLNAVILDSPPAHSSSSQQPPRVLCTAADALPSVVIEQQYEGHGAFDRDNADFLRMYKTSADWTQHDKYTAFLSKLKANGQLGNYSLTLHAKFISAATELCAQCGLQLSELDLLYWQPTQAVVTVVVRVSSAVGERVEKTTNCRFVAQEKLYDALKCMAEDIDGKQWMDELVSFHARSTLPPPPPPQPVPLLGVSQPLSTFRSRMSQHTPPRSPQGQLSPKSGDGAGAAQPAQGGLRRFFTNTNTVSPAPSPRPPEPAADTAAASTSPRSRADSTSGKGMASVKQSNTDGPALPVCGYRLFLGLHFVKVEANGLQVMLLNDGPFHHVPLTEMLESPTPFNTLSAEHTAHLRDLRLKHLDFELGAQCLLPPPGTTHDKAAGAEKKLHEAAQDGGKAAPGGGGAKSRFATSRTPSLSDESDDEVDDDASTVRGERNVKDTLKHLKQAASNASSNSSPASPSSVQPPTALSVDLATFSSAFNNACYSLAMLVGTSVDMQPANLTQLQLLPYGRRDWVLAFSVVRMSNRLDDYAQHSAIRWVSLKAFEILHFARHERAEGKGWTRRWIRERTRRQSTAAGASGGLHEEADGADSGGRSRQGTDRVADGSASRRVAGAGHALKGSDSGPLLKSHQRGLSVSHQRTSSVSGSKQKVGLTLSVVGHGLGSLPGSMPGTARVELLMAEEEDTVAGMA